MAITYTPTGAARVEGFYNEANPYDTGRPGEKNTELNGGVGGGDDGWDRDKGVWSSDPMFGGGGGSTGGGGGSSGLSNPYFQQYQAAVAAQQAADLSDTKSQIQQLLIQFGMVPGSFQDKLGSLDDTIRALIQKNSDTGISMYARMLEGKNDTLSGTVGRLSAKGLRRSGTKGYRLNRNQLDYDRTFSDAVGALLGNANSLQSGYAGREAQRQQSLAQMLASIFANYRGGGGGGGGGSFAPVAPPAAPAPQWQDWPTVTTQNNGYTYAQPNAQSVAQAQTTNPTGQWGGGRMVLID